MNRKHEMANTKGRAAFKEVWRETEDKAEAQAAYDVAYAAAEADFERSLDNYIRDRAYRF